MKRCPHCGTTLPLVKDAFCPECREPLAEPAISRATTAPAGAPALADQAVFVAKHKQRLGCLGWLVLLIFGVFGAAALSTGAPGPMLLGGFCAFLVVSAIVEQLRRKPKYLVIDQERIRDDLGIPQGMRWENVRRVELIEKTEGFSVRYSVALYSSEGGLPRTVDLNFDKTSWQEACEVIKTAWSRAIAQRPPAAASEAASPQADAASSPGQPPAPLEACYSRGWAWTGMAASLLLGGLLTVGGLGANAPHIMLFGVAIGFLGGSISWYRLSDHGPKFAIDQQGLLLPRGIRWDEIERVAFETKTQRYGACRTLCYARLYLRNGREVRLDLNDLDRAPGELYERLIQGVEYGRQARAEAH